MAMVGDGCLPISLSSSVKKKIGRVIEDLVGGAGGFEGRGCGGGEG